MNKLLKRIISIVLICSFVLSASIGVFASSNKESTQKMLIFMGDSMSYNFSARHSYKADLENSFAYIIAKEKGYTVVNEKNYQGHEPFSFGGGRATDLYASISDEYGGDDYSVKSYPWDFDAEEYSIDVATNLEKRREAVKSASAVIIQLGYSNFSPFVFSNLLYHFGLSGFGSDGSRYSVDLKNLLDDADKEKYEAFARRITDRLNIDFRSEMEELIKSNEALYLISDLIASTNYTVIAELYHFDKLIKEIKSLNPDIDIYVLGLSNPIDITISFDILGKNIKLPVYKLAGDVLGGLNTYMKYFSPVRCMYTYVEPPRFFETYGNLMGKVGNKTAEETTKGLLTSIFEDTIKVNSKPTETEKTTAAEYASKLYIGAMQVAQDTNYNASKMLKSASLDEIAKAFETVAANDAGTMEFLKEAFAVDKRGKLTSKPYQQYLAHIYLLASLSSLYSHPTQAAHNAMAEQILKAWK